jgi:hypothetical protein
MQFDPIYNRATTSGLLTATGAETVYDTTVTIAFSVEGKAYTKAAVTDGATPTTDYNTGAAFAVLTGAGSSAGGQGCAFVWALTAAGAVKVMQGPVVSVDASGNFAIAPQFPSIPSDVTPFAYSISKHYGVSTTFTFGTDNWNKSGHSHAIQNVHVLPRRPQTS